MSSVSTLLRSVIARVGSFVPTAIAQLVTSHLVIHHYDLATFDSFALVISLIALIPLNDLGVGGAVVSAYAQDGPTSEHAQRVTLTAARTLILSALAVIAIAVGLTAGHLWPRLLGPASGANFYVGLAVAIYALSFVPGLSPSMLLGVNRNHTTIIVQAFFAPTILLGAALLIVFHLNGRWATVVPTAAILVIQLATLVVAARVTEVPWRRLLHRLPRRRRYPGASIRSISLPMMVIILSLPLSLQTDRIVLSHVASLRAVANYSVVVQMFAPVLALVTAASQPLWPMYAQARRQNVPGPNLLRISLLFGTGAAVLSAIIVAIAGPLARDIGGKSMNIGILLPVAAALTVMVQALIGPLAMKLTDPPGLRVIATWNVIAIPINLGMSIVLAQHLGAPGPLLATATTMLLVQTLPLSLYARRRTLRQRARTGASPLPRSGPASDGSGRRREPGRHRFVTTPAGERSQLSRKNVPSSWSSRRER